jgi:hypothetical protein
MPFVIFTESTKTGCGSITRRIKIPQKQGLEKTEKE